MQTRARLAILLVLLGWSVDTAGDPDDDEAAAARFVRANLLRQADQLDAAALDLVVILEHHRDHEVAEYAANLLIDGLIRTGRHDDMIRWVRVLRADVAFVATNPELGARLLDLEQQGLRKQAERAEQDAAARHDRDGYATCAALYDQVRALAPATNRGEEATYNAARCFAAAGDADAARARYREVVDGYPRSRLAERALLEHARLAQRLGDVAGAAASFARYARAYPAEPAGRDAARDAVTLHLALGERDAATRDAAWLAKTYGRVRPLDAVRAFAAVAAARLDHGERAAARRTLADVVRLWRPSSRDGDAALAELVWDGACLAAPVDGLCGRRAPRLARFVMTQLAPAAGARGQRLLADAAFEALRAIPTPAVRRRDAAWRARVTAAAVAARAAYEHVLLQPDLDADTAISTYARLGQVALHRHALAIVDRVDAPDALGAARAAFVRCADRAIAEPRPALLARCDDGLVRAGSPPPPAPERRAAPGPAAPAPEPEPVRTPDVR